VVEEITQDEIEFINKVDKIAKSKIVFPNFEKVVQIKISAPAKVKYGIKPMNFIVMVNPISVDKTSSLM